MSRQFVGSPTGILKDGNAAVTAAPCTIAAWIYVDTIPASASQYDLVYIGDNSFTNYFGLEVDHSGLIRAITVGNFSRVASTSAGLSTGSWNHACAVFASTTSRAAYLNGANKGTNAQSATVSSIVTTAVGAAWAGTPTNVCIAKIGEIGIWNVALTDAEVAALAVGIAPSRIRPASLVRYYPLIGRTSPELDLKSGKSLTLTGTANQFAHCRVYYSPPLQQLFVPSGATAYTQNFTGSITPTGSLVKAGSFAKTGSITPSGGLVKLDNKIVAGTVTPSGAFISQDRKVFSGTTTPSGTLVRNTALQKSGSTTPTGANVFQITQIRSGNITPTGLLTSAVQVSFLGNVVVDGVIQKQATIQNTGAVTPAGALQLIGSILLTGVITVSGALSTIGVLIKSFVGSVVTSGILVFEVLQNWFGTISPSGSLQNTQMSGIQLTGQVTVSGTLENLSGRYISFTGLVSLSGVLVQSVRKALSGFVTTLGNLVGLFFPSFKSPIVFEDVVRITSVFTGTVNISHMKDIVAVLTSFRSDLSILTVSSESVKVKSTYSDTMKVRWEG